MARENTRAGISDALKRTKVFASTGDRAIIPVFAGWDFAPSDINRVDFAQDGYAHAVPMGGDSFDATQLAFYYVRVIQIPSPRWTAYDRKRYGIKMSPEVPMTCHRSRLHLTHLVYAGKMVVDRFEETRAR